MLDARPTPAAPPGVKCRIAIFAASEDRFFDARVVEAMWQRWGEPTIHWYPTSHMGFIPRLPAAARQMRRRIDRYASRPGR